MSLSSLDTTVEEAESKWDSLVAAAVSGDVTTFEREWERIQDDDGVEVNAYCQDGSTLLYLAAAGGHTSTVIFLVDTMGADVCKATQDDAKALLVESYKTNPPPPEMMDESDGRACPLYIAARNNHPDTVRALIDRGADVNQTQCDGCSVAFATAYEGHAGVLTIILENGGDAHAAAEDGTTPTSVAATEGHAAALQVCGWGSRVIRVYREYRVYCVVTL